MWSQPLTDFPQSIVRRTSLLPLVAIALAVAGTNIASSPARAAGETTLTVTAGIGDGWHDPGDHVVVTATVTTDELVDGHIDVVSSSGAVVTREIQVAGGTTKAFSLVAPTGFDLAPITVNLYRGNELVSKKSLTLRLADAVELVGVLPALVARAGDLPDQVKVATGGSAVLTELSVEQMSLGSAALEAFDSIAATAADVRSLQPAQLAALLGWLNRGGRLLLDDAGDLSALPEEWRPGNAGYALAGRGEVRLIDGKGSNNQWAAVIEPSGSSTNDNANFFGSNENVGLTQQDLALRAGVKQPSLVPLLVPLVAYTVIVSVVLYFVLRATRRMTLAWVAIPALASVTALGVFVYGQQWRAVGKPAAATFIESYPGGADAYSSVLTFSRDGGTSTIHLPAGWQSDSEVTQYFFGPSGISPRLTSSATDTEVQVRLEPGQVTTANVLGPTSEAGLLATASVRDDEVVGTVTNHGTITLYQVAVFGPGGVDDIGTLAPGASADFAIDADPLPAGFTRVDRVWKGTANPNATDDEIAELGIWTNAGFGRSMYPSALVRAAGWTTELGNGLDVTGGFTSTTVVTSLAPIRPTSGPIPAATIRATLARTPFGMFGNGLGDTIYRYVLPPDAPLGQGIVFEIPAGLTAVDLWNGSGWVNQDGDRRGRVVVEPAMRADGVILVRFNSADGFFGDQIPEVRGIEPGEFA
ncbi:MAG: hypothetical protein K8R99_02805 [Actinomycetia bacterium]|nr:hypothetical protein [Actinomycetes bacterium]